MLGQAGTLGPQFALLPALPFLQECEDPNSRVIHNQAFTAMLEMIQMVWANVM